MQNSQNTLLRFGLWLQTQAKVLWSLFKSVAWPIWRSEASKLKPILIAPQNVQPHLFSSIQERLAFFALALGSIGIIALWIDPWVTAHQHLWNSTLYAIMRKITHFGSSGIYLFPLGLLSLILSILSSGNFTARQSLSIRIWAARALYLFIIIAGSGLLATLLKRVIGRARPKLFEIFGALHFNPISAKSYFASFPSGHATTAFAVAIGLCFFLPRWRIVLIASAATIAFSRIVLGSHHVSDTIMGALIGATFAIFFTQWFASRRYVFVLDSNQKIRIRGQKISPLGIGAISTMLHTLFSTPKNKTEKPS